MSEDGSVDFSVGVEITNISAFVDQIKKELVNIIPDTPEIQEKITQDPDYGKAHEELSESKKIINTIGIKFDEIMTQFKELAFAQNVDLMKDIQSALKKIPQNFAVDLANAEGLIDKLTLSVQEMLKSGDIKVEGMEAPVNSEQVNQVLQELDTTKLERLTDDIQRMLFRSLDIADVAIANNSEIEDVLKDMGSILATIAGGVMTVTDVQDFTRIILSQTMQSASIQSQSVAQFRRATVESQMGVALGTVARIEEQGVEEFLVGETPREMINPDDLRAQITSTENALQLFYSSAEGFTDILEKIKEKTGITLRETNLRSSQQGVIMSTLSPAEQMQMTKMMVALEGLASVNISNEAKENFVTGTWLSNISLRAPRDRVTRFVERISDRGEEDFDQTELLNTVLEYNPQELENYMNTLLGLLSGSRFNELQTREFQLDSASIALKEGIDKVDLENIIKEKLQREGISEAEAIQIIMKNLQPTGVEVKGMDKISTGVIEENITRMNKVIANFAKNFLDEMKQKAIAEGDQLQLTDTLQDLKEVEDKVRDFRDEFKEIVKLIFIYKSGILTPQQQATIRGHGLTSGEFEEGEVGRISTAVRTGDFQAMPNIMAIASSVASTEFEQAIRNQGGDIPAQLQTYRDQIIEAQDRRMAEILEDNSEMEEMMGQLTEVMGVLRAIQRRYNIRPI